MDVALAITILLAFLFAMSGGAWSGRYVALEFDYFSIGGLVPHSDALAYFGGIFDLAYTGHWNEAASWRPFAAAFRDLTVFAIDVPHVEQIRKFVESLDPVESLLFWMLDCRPRSGVNQSFLYVAKNDSDTALS